MSTNVPAVQRRCVGNGDRRQYRGSAAQWRGASDDGSHVFFSTKEALVPSDTDGGCSDSERRDHPLLRRLRVFGREHHSGHRRPQWGNGSFSAGFRGASADGSRVFFRTQEQLVASDTDDQRDIYQRSGGTTTLISTGPNGGNGAFEPTYRGSSKDGTHVFFETDESLVAADTDSSTDIYDRSGGATTLVSTGPAGGNGASPPPSGAPPRTGRACSSRPTSRSSPPTRTPRRRL